jgi:Cu/Ag efflux protein CusF
MRRLAAVIAATAFAWPAFAAEDHDLHDHGDPKVTVSGPQYTQGEVRRVDKPGGRITVRHGRIYDLDMPPMTMVFRVKDATLLDRLKAGDKIDFLVEKQDGNYVITGVKNTP